MMADIYMDGNICKHIEIVNHVTYHNAPLHLKLVCADLMRYNAQQKEMQD